MTERLPLIGLFSGTRTMPVGIVSGKCGESKRGSQFMGGVRVVVREVCEGSDSLGRAVSDHYRCPIELVAFAHTLESGQKEPEFFRFGSANCYGRLSLDGLQQFDYVNDDVRKLASLSDGTVRLPFNPTEIVDNLRLERYAKDEAACDELFRKLYYRVRPLTTMAVRKRIQQFHARNWRSLEFPAWPVDTTVENLCEELLLLSMKAQGMDKLPFVWFWPRGVRGCVMMTHDVETRTGAEFCDQLMDVDDSFAIKASFQIVPEDRYEFSDELLHRIRARGFEIGIQDLNHDGRLFDNEKEFLRRAEIINRYANKYSAKGFRAAVLYRKPEWLQHLNFSFDMSMPNVAHLDPQRGGCCTVFPYFIGDTVELPLTATQDYTLLHILNDRSVELWKAQTELILAKHGLASFIVHPDYVNESSTMAVYKELLSNLSRLREERQLWFALPSDVDAWWRARSKMKVIGDGNSWRIEGEGSDRAVLAYATVKKNRLVYDLPEGTASA
jgi:hypothetical protein